MKTYKIVLITLLAVNLTQLLGLLFLSIIVYEGILPQQENIEQVNARLEEKHDAGNSQNELAALLIEANDMLIKAMNLIWRFILAGLVVSIANCTFFVIHMIVGPGRTTEPANSAPGMPPDR